MSNTLNDIIKQINNSTDKTISNIVLKEKRDIDLQVNYNSGLFKITPALISFVAISKYDILYLEDVYGNPIQINREEFFNIISKQYNETMKQWFDNYNKINE
jgi:hypothetical protein